MNPKISVSIVGVALLAVGLLVALTHSTYRIDDSGHSPEQLARLTVTESFSVPLASFRMDLGRFPSSVEGICALLTAPSGEETRWKGPYIRTAKLPVDPWGRQYLYRYPSITNSESYDLWSTGPDLANDSDDIGNWNSRSPTMR